MPKQKSKYGSAPICEGLNKSVQQKQNLEHVFKPPVCFVLMCKEHAKQSDMTPKYSFASGKTSPKLIHEDSCTSSMLNEQET